MVTPWLSNRTCLKQAIKTILRRTIYRKLIQQPTHHRRPFQVRFDVTNRCNQACRTCFYPQFSLQQIPPHNLSVEDFKAVADKVFSFTSFLQVASSFENLLHPQIEKLIQVLDQYDIPSVGMITNGVLLSGERAEALADCRSLKMMGLSLDGVGEETYLRMRGRPHLRQVQENILNFMHLRKRKGRIHPQLKVNTLLARSNRHELSLILEWCIKHNIDEIEFIDVKPITPENKECLRNDPEEYTRVWQELQQLGQGAKIRVLLPHLNGTALGGGNRRRSISRSHAPGLSCTCPWTDLHIDCHGDVYTCNPFKASPPIGNLIRQSLGDVINSIRILKIRKYFTAGRLLEECKMCMDRA